MPYGVYKLYFSNSSDVFTKDFEDYCNRRSHNEEVNDELILNKSYKQVVSVQGLGHSGSGAVLDVLCEMESCNVLGTDENFKVLGIDHKGAFEVDFLRLAGGLFEFEKYLGSNNVFQNDALINRFISYLNSFKLFREDKNIRELFFDFLYIKRTNFSNIIFHFIYYFISIKICYYKTSFFKKNILNKFT